jgi:murein DD-endopeptidase MepM/ murein hydrolase activator NlpD
MKRSATRSACLTVVLGTLSGTSAPATEGALREVRWGFAPTWRDGLSAEDRRARAELTRKWAAIGPAGGEATAALDLVTLPQAGTFGADNFVFNYVDLDPRSGPVLDWDCSGYTYDGHQGHDISIQGFREQAIGVPVFAAAPGRVVDVVDVHPDDSTDWIPKPANRVVIDHGSGWLAYHYHVKTGSAVVAVGDLVTAGTQIASVGSSGISTGPHLHFELRENGVVREPSAGPCRAGDALWRAQQPVNRATYASEVFFSLEPLAFDGTDEDFWRAIAFERRARVGAIGRGARPVYLWMILQNLAPGAAWRMRLIDPKKRLRDEQSGVFDLAQLARWGFGEFLYDQVWTAGDWRLVFEVDGAAIVDTKFTVGKTAKAPKNRPPQPIRVALDEPTVDADRPTICRVTQDLVNEDRDHDLVSYRYLWLVDGVAVRALESAALSDTLAAGLAGAGAQVVCRVRPFDGKVLGREAEARTP